MKKYILILLLIPVTLNATTYYVSSYTGDDGDNGSTWALAFQTLGQADNTVSAGDTVVCNGTWGALTVNGNHGTSGNTIVWIDSLRYTNGYNNALPQTTYSASIVVTSAAFCIDIQRNYHEFLGFSMVGSSSCLGNVQTNSDYDVLKNCYLECSVLNSSNFWTASGATDDSLISCLMVRKTNGGGNNVFSYYNCFLYNCTFIISGNISLCQFTLSNALGNPDGRVKNCLFCGSDITSEAKRISLNGTNVTDEYDYNIYYWPNQADTYYGIGASNYDSHADFETALGAFLEGAEASSSQENINFLETTNYTIDNSSPAWNTASDIGYGTNRGYYQEAGSASTRKNVIIIN